MVVVVVVVVVVGVIVVIVVLEILLFCVYSHACLAKLSKDWLRAEPLRHWLPKRVK